MSFFSRAFSLSIIFSLRASDYIHAAEPRLTFVECVLADTVPPADFSRRHVAFLFAQYCNNLLFTKA